MCIVEVLEISGGRSPLIIRGLDAYLQLPCSTGAPTLNSEEPEIATLDWVHWWNTARLHEGLGYRIPAEVEAAYKEAEVTAPAVH